MTIYLVRAILPKARKKLHFVSGRLEALKDKRVTSLKTRTKQGERKKKESYHVNYVQQSASPFQLYLKKRITCLFFFPFLVVE